jgi:tetratricopeptide (TPR) repeat protein
MVPGVCLLLIAIVFLVFGQTVRHPFVNYDDNIYFSANPQIQVGLTGNGVIWAFRTGHGSNWHPLTWLSLMLDAQLFGTGPTGPHLTNVLLHAANTVLLFLLLGRLTGALWSSAFLAAIFASHPLHVESVAWVAERKDVLSGLFFMLTLLMYGHYVEKSKVHNPKSRVFYSLSLLFFALGLMSKPMLVTLPFVLLLLDWWPLRRVSSFKFQVSSLRLIWEKIPFLLLSIASCAVTLFAQQSVIAPAEAVPLSLRISTALVSYVTYFVQTVWPDNLAVLYPYHYNIPAGRVAGAGVLLLSVTAGVIAAARRFPGLLVGWLWYLGMLVPVIGLVQVGGQAHADRYMYLPQIGLSLVLVEVVRNLTGWGHRRRQVLGVMGCVVVAALAVCAWQQTAYWRNSQSLWEHTLACTSENYIAHTNLGYVLATQSRSAEAIEHYQKALEINPDYAEAHNDLGTVFLKQGQSREAIGCYRRALEINPDFAEAYYNLGCAYDKQGDLDKATGYYQKAIEVRADLAEAYYSLGMIFKLRGRLDDAVEFYRKAIRSKPDYADAHGNLADVLMAQGKLAEAVKEYQRTLELMPDSVHVRYQLGLGLRGLGKFAAAIAQFQAILELDPRHVPAKNNLAWLLATCPEASVRNGARAVELAQQAERLSGGTSPEILDTLAAAYAEAGRFDEAVTTARRALNLLATQTNQPLATAIQNRLRLYEMNSTFRDAGHTSSGGQP